MPLEKPYSEQTIDERITSLDRMQNVLGHQDWREMYLRFADEAALFRREMEDAQSWENFVANRAVYQYITRHLMNLSTLVKEEKEELEVNKLAEGQPLPIPEYEE